MNKNIDTMKNFLFETIIKLQTVKDCEMLFADLCTVNEVDQMAQRVQAAKLLLEKKTYNQVIAETDISSATLSRVSTCVRHGAGGYKKFVEFDGESARQNFDDEKKNELK
ncbi:MAG: YerC/YecD family TrpR-related protein [Clostridia bacterium]